MKGACEEGPARLGRVLERPRPEGGLDRRGARRPPLGGGLGPGQRAAQCPARRRRGAGPAGRGTIHHRPLLRRQAQRPSAQRRGRVRGRGHSRTARQRHPGVWTRVPKVSGGAGSPSDTPRRSFALPARPEPLTHLADQQTTGDSLPDDESAQNRARRRLVGNRQLAIVSCRRPPPNAPSRWPAPAAPSSAMTTAMRKEAGAGAGLRGVLGPRRCRRGARAACRPVAAAPQPSNHGRARRAD